MQREGRWQHHCGCFFLVDKLLRRTSGRWTGRPFRLRLGRAEVARLRRRVKPAAPSEFSKWRLSGNASPLACDDGQCALYCVHCCYASTSVPAVVAGRVHRDCQVYLEEMAKQTRMGAVGCPDCFGGWQGEQELRKNIIECVNPDCLVPALSHSRAPPRCCNHTPRPGLRPASIPSRDTHRCHNPTHPPPHLQTAPYL